MSKEEMRESPRGRSQLSLYQSCNRKWAFKYVKGWKTPDDDYGPLSFGSVIHEAQAEVYKKKSKKAGQLIINKMHPIKEDSSIHLKNFRDKVDKTFEKWYTEVGANDLENYNILMVEEELLLQLPNGYVMTIRVDRVLQRKTDLEIFINDTKTTGWSLEGTLTKYLIHDQPRLYILAVRQNKPEWLEHFTGWRTDVLFVKKAPRSPGGYNIKFRRSPPVQFTDTELNDTLTSYAGVVDDIAGKLPFIEKEPLASLYPANYEHCTAFNRICEYNHVCPLIDTQSEPPADLELDPWLSSRTVLKSFMEDMVSHEQE